MQEACSEPDIRSAPIPQLSPWATWSVWMCPPHHWVIFRSVLDVSSWQGIIISLQTKNISYANIRLSITQYTSEMPAAKGRNSWSGSGQAWLSIGNTGDRVSIRCLLGSRGDYADENPTNYAEMGCWYLRYFCDILLHCNVDTACDFQKLKVNLENSSLDADNILSTQYTHPSSMAFGFFFIPLLLHEPTEQRAVDVAIKKWLLFCELFAIYKELRSKENATFQYAAIAFNCSQKEDVLRVSQQSSNRSYGALQETVGMKSKNQWRQLMTFHRNL